MSKAQFWLLNFVGGACAVLLLGNAFFVRINDRVIRELEATQVRINRAQQIQNTAQNLIARITRAAQTEPAMKDLLTRHQLKAELDHEPAAALPHEP